MKIPDDIIPPQNNISAISQKICSKVELPQIDYQHDCRLDTPVLISPPDSSRPCQWYQDDLDNWHQGVELLWQDVPNATHYVVQLSLNSNFYGPSLQTQVVPATQSSLGVPLITGDLNLGQLGIYEDEQYYWRVYAIEEGAVFGCASEKSSAWTFTPDCVVLLSPPNGNEPNENPSKCEASGTTVEIIGPDTIEAGTSETYCLKITWRCADSEGNLITPTGYKWEFDPQDTQGTFFEVQTSPDTDSDGVPDDAEGKDTNQDTDGDTVPDYQDSDDDNDGLPTSSELADIDGDGVPDYLDDNIVVASTPGTPSVGYSPDECVKLCVLAEDCPGFEAGDALIRLYVEFYDSNTASTFVCKGEKTVSVIETSVEVGCGLIRDKDGRISLQRDAFENSNPNTLQLIGFMPGSCCPTLIPVAACQGDEASLPDCPQGQDCSDPCETSQPTGCECFPP